MFPFGSMQNLYEEERSMEKNLVQPFKLTNLTYNIY